MHFAILSSKYHSLVFSMSTFSCVLFIREYSPKKLFHCKHTHTTKIIQLSHNCLLPRCASVFYPPTKPLTNHEMKIIPVPMVRLARRPYRKRPQGSGGFDGLRRFLIGVLAGAMAALQVRLLKLLVAILAAPRRNCWSSSKNRPAALDAPGKDALFAYWRR